MYLTKVGASAAAGVLFLGLVFVVGDGALPFTRNASAQGMMEREHHREQGFGHGRAIGTGIGIGIDIIGGAVQDKMRRRGEGGEAIDFSKGRRTTEKGKKQTV